jgi:hypothetical protein
MIDELTSFVAGASEALIVDRYFDVFQVGEP